MARAYTPFSFVSSIVEIPIGRAQLYGVSTAFDTNGKGVASTLLHRPPDPRADLGGYRFAVGKQRRIKWFEKIERRRDRFPIRQKSPEILGDLFIANPCNAAGVAAITQKNWLNHHARRRRNKSCKQRSLERQQPRPVAGGAFGKDRHRLIAGHRGAQVVNLVANAQLVFTADEDCVIDVAQPPDQRPAFDAVIGDEGATGDARDYWNINPAMMVGGVENVSADSFASRCGRDPAGPAHRQQKQPWPGRALAEQLPDDVQYDSRDQAGDDNEQPCHKQKLADNKCRRIDPFNPYGRGQRHIAPFGGRPDDIPAFRR